MKKISMLALSALCFATAPANAAEVFGYNGDVKCLTPDYVIQMRPRAPKVRESAEIYEMGGQTFIQGKVDVKITERKTGKLVDEFVANDVTDPWESAWPNFQLEAKGFGFFSQNSGQPSGLRYAGKELASETRCRH